MSRHKQLPGIDIDAVHRTWPYQRRSLFRRVLAEYFRPLRGQPAHVWVMLALAIGVFVGLSLGVIA